MATTKETTTKIAETVKTIAELEKELSEKQADQLAAKKSHGAGELTNPRVLRTLRRDVARIKTALSANNKETK